MVEKDYWKKHYHANKEKWKGYIKKYQQSAKGKKKIKEYNKEYYQRPDVREKIREADKKRYTPERKLYKTINKQIRRCIVMIQKDAKLNLKFNTYDKYSIIYGIDLNKIIKKLQPFPKDMENYELDHIIPITKFDLTKKNQIKKAYDPNNLQLLTSHKNKIKNCH